VKRVRLLCGQIFQGMNGLIGIIDPSIASSVFVDDAPVFADLSFVLSRMKVLLKPGESMLRNLFKRGLFERCVHRAR
jgi:hypothetical protein